jgi:hypothetical protein
VLLPSRQVAAGKTPEMALFEALTAEGVDTAALTAAVKTPPPQTEAR